MEKEKKEFVIGSILLVILILLTIFLITYVLYIKEKEKMLNIPENKYNVTDYIYIEKVDYNKYNNVFNGNLEIPKITLKNIDESIINDFENNETDILLEIVNSTKELESRIEDNEYTPVSTINIDMDYKIFNNILSIKYILTIKLDFNLDTIIRPLYLNYDIETGKVLSNTELLNLLEYNPLEISEYLLNNVVLKGKNDNDSVTDSISNKEITIRKINENKDEYINRISEKIDNLYIFINGDNILLGYFYNDLINICYLSEENNKYEFIQYKKDRLE